MSTLPGAPDWLDKLNPMDLIRALGGPKTPPPPASSSPRAMAADFSGGMGGDFGAPLPADLRQEVQAREYAPLPQAAPPGGIPQYEPKGGILGTGRGWGEAFKALAQAGHAISDPDRAAALSPGYHDWMEGRHDARKQAFIDEHRLSALDALMGEVTPIQKSVLGLMAPDERVGHLADLVLAQQDPYTLGPGQVRFGPDNQEVARGMAPSASSKDQFSAAQTVMIDGKPMRVIRNLTTGETITLGEAQPRANSGGIQIRPDGTITIGGGGGGPLGNRGQGITADALAESTEAAGGTDRILTLLNDARNIFDRGQVNTGPVNRLSTAVSGIMQDTGAADLLEGITGREVIDEGRLADSETLRSISNELGAAMLTMFGGSDTERELQVSLQANIGPDRSEIANEQIWRRSLAAVEVQREKPDFRTRWIERFGGIDRVDPNSGMTMQQAWDRKLKQQFPEFFGSGTIDQGRDRDNDVNRPPEAQRAIRNEPVAPPPGFRLVE